MEGLFSFLLFAGLFYFMMRHGCGAHMAHGHHEEKNINDSFVDPVCGRKVEDDQGYGKLQDGHLYRFCSKDCLDTFDLEPKRFIKERNTNAEKSTEKTNEP